MVNANALKDAVKKYLPGGTRVIRKVLPKRTTFWLIYKMNHWANGESFSGPGSTLETTIDIRTQLPKLLLDYSVTSMLDAACGDFHWMKEVELPCTYVGAEIVGDLAVHLEREYGSPGRTFIQRDVCRGPFPKVDLIFCREVTIHLPTKNVKQALEAFRRSGSTYLMITHHTDVTENFDIPIGGWRPINFTLPPFSFPEPLRVIHEEAGVDREDKSMALWRCSDLPVGT
jgi:hypothetical protein